MDIMNLTRTGPGEYEIRFKYKDPLTGKQKYIRRRMNGTLEEARALRDQLKAAAKSGAMRNQTQNQTRTLRSYVHSFGESRANGRRGRRVSRATLERDGFALKDHIIPDAGDWIVSRITDGDLDVLVDSWLEKPKNASGDPYSVSTVNTWIKVFKLLMRHACKREGIESPAELLRPIPRSAEQTGCALEAEQVAQFLDQMREDYPQWFPMCVLGFMTGARFSTLSALRWEDVDYDNRAILFLQSQYRGTRKERDKAGKRVRVPLLEPMRAALQTHRERMLREEHPGLSTGLVFPSTVVDGAQHGHLSASGLRKAMRRTCEALGRDFPVITPHDMRRTFNTLAFEAAIDEHVIQSIIGHSTDRMSYHYDHVSEDRKTEGLARLAQVYKL